jgi:hypothetical protein
MNKHILIISLILIFNIDIFAQETEIKNIKDYYYKVSEQIKQKELYCNQTELNKLGESSQNWPAVGLYYERITFWYNTAPAHWDEKGEEAIVKIEIKNIYSAFEENTEYLFKDGKLIFCYISAKDISEHRYYFSNEILIKYLEKIILTDNAAYKKEDSELVIKKSKKIQKYFINMFDY